MKESRLFNFFKRKQKVEPVESPTPKVPLFEEVFTISEFLTSDLKVDEIAITDALAENVLNSLLTPLVPYVEKLAENPSDQQKALLEILRQVKVKGAQTLGHSEWSYSSGNGIGARVIIGGKSRIALVGSAHALARATAKFDPSIDAVVQQASKDGNVVYLLAIDAIAIAAIVLTHKLVEIKG
jgi:hypothetical protein